MSEDYLSVAETAKKLGVSPRTIQRYCKDGRLNHKWVKGKRHKELRILQPIQISHLPCGRRKNLADTFDYVTKIDFEEITSELNRKLSALEEENEKLKSIITHSDSPHGIISDKLINEMQMRDKLSTFLHEFKKVRPAEKRLILKLAKDVKDIEDQLKSRGIMESEIPNPENE